MFLRRTSSRRHLLCSGGVRACFERCSCTAHKNDIRRRDSLWHRRVCLRATVRALATVSGACGRDRPTGTDRGPFLRRRARRAVRRPPYTSRSRRAVLRRRACRRISSAPSTGSSRPFLFFHNIFLPR